MQQGSPEWHEFRRGKIGGSDAPIIMGVSPWCKPKTLWERKLGLIPEQESSYAMQRGVLLEEQARQSFEEQTGYRVFPDVRVHPKLPWMIASLDGITMEGDAIVEIKCPSPGGKSHKEAMDGRIPTVYKPQLQHQMLVCGLEEAFYWSYDGERGILLREMADPEYQRALLYREVAFYECMRSGVSPVEDSKSGHEEWLLCAERLREAMINQQQIDNDVKSLRAQLIAMSSEISWPMEGAGLRLSLVRRRGDIEYSRIPALRNIDLEPYRGPDKEYWTVKIKD